MREGLHKIASSDDTIVAIATPRGRSAMGVVRISGPNSLAIAKELFQSAKPLEHRRQIVGTCRDLSGEEIDEVTIVFARHPHSYTGEDLIEITAHGNPAVLDRLLHDIRRRGARLANPGEFTLRAVANGKMDLLQAEAVHDFIEAQTEQQARTALRQMEGSGARKIQPLKQQLVDTIARLEAGIDFAEDDVEIPSADAVSRHIQPLIHGLDMLKDTFGYGRMLAQGLHLAILGKPNVGKSSLFNRLLALDRAIVTEIPGTTRDVLTEAVSLEGIPLRLMDTAGLRETSDRVEQIGVGKSLEALASADLALVVLDGSQPLTSEDEEVIHRTREIPRLIVINKADLPQTLTVAANGRQSISVSARTGSGIENLQAAIASFLTQNRADSADDFILTNARQYVAVVRAVESLRAADSAIIQKVPHEMVLLDLYAALSSLNELTGETVTEDILDKIFSTFCIGK